MAHGEFSLELLYEVFVYSHTSLDERENFCTSIGFEAGFLVIQFHQKEPSSGLFVCDGVQ